MTAKRRLIICMAVVTLTSRDVHAEPPPVESGVIHLKSESHVETVKGSVLQLPPGDFLDEPSWAKIDAETKRLQERETRLAAENASLRKSADDVSFGWAFVAGLAVAAFGAGYALGR